MWDIRGKMFGAPVYRLLGGPTRDWVRTYRHVGIYDPDALLEEAQGYVDQGVRALKTGAWTQDTHLSSSQRVEHAARRLCDLRRLVGDGVDILIDNHGRSRPDEAIRFIRAVAGRPASVVGGAHPAREPGAPPTRQPRSPAARYLRGSGRAIVLPLGIPSRPRAATGRRPPTGPVSRRRHHRDDQDRRHGRRLPVHHRPHNPGGPVSTAAAAHVTLAIPNFDVLEYCPDEPRRSQVAPGSWEHRGDQLFVPARPGLGVELDIDAIEERPPQATAVPTQAYGSDGSIADI